MKAMRVSKLCTTCRRVKLLDEFSLETAHLDGLRDECRRCAAVRTGVQEHNVLSPLPDDKQERVVEALRAKDEDYFYFDREHDARAALEELTA